MSILITCVFFIISKANHYLGGGYAYPPYNYNYQIPEYAYTPTLNTYNYTNAQNTDPRLYYNNYYYSRNGDGLYEHDGGMGKYTLDNGFVGMYGQSGANTFNVHYMNEQRANPYAYEAATGQNNAGLDTALRYGRNGLVGLSAAAGLEGGLGHGSDSNTDINTPVEETTMNNLEQIFNYHGASLEAGHRKAQHAALSADKSNDSVGGMLGAAALNGNGGTTGAAGLGKKIGNQAGFGANLGGMLALAASEAINGDKIMAPEDLGKESKETLGATTSAAKAAKEGASVGARAGQAANIADAKALETLAGLGEGMAMANTLDEHAEAVKSQGLESGAALTPGYAGIPGAVENGSFMDLLGLGPGGEAMRASSAGLGKKGGSDVALAAAENAVKIIKDLQDDKNRKKQDIIEDELKSKMLANDLKAQLGIQ